MKDEKCLLEIFTPITGIISFEMNQSISTTCKELETILENKLSHYKINVDSVVYLIPHGILTTSPIVISEYVEKTEVEQGIKRGNVIKIFKDE